MTNGNGFLITLQRSSIRGISANSSKLDSFHVSFSIFSLDSPFSVTPSLGTTGVEVVAICGTAGVEVVDIGGTAALASPLLVASC